MRTVFFFSFFIFICLTGAAQNTIKGFVRDMQGPVPFAKVKLPEEGKNTLTDDRGYFEFTHLSSDPVIIEIYATGYNILRDTVSMKNTALNYLEYKLLPPTVDMDAVVVSGTLKEVSKKESSVNIEVFSSQFFKKNPNPSIYDALQNINGVRPQLNCNICNTGDIHINGLEGPYTMILIDGMPIVSSLSTVYGLSGIPTSLVERIEIVKGPSSTLYGSEAIGGVINVITKLPQRAPLVYADVYTTSWLETNADISFKLKPGNASPVSILTGINYFNYDWKQDRNQDGFTDVTLQDRISIFQKWNFKRKASRRFSLAGRYVYEDRWGGQLNWTPEFRGGDSIYGESIYTSRWEFLGLYQLPFREKVYLSGSFNQHQQNSYYGDTPFMADQQIGFLQLYWDKTIGIHDFVLGTASRYTYYDDSTPATEMTDSLSTRNVPSNTIVPGVYIQDEVTFSKDHKLLLGARYDYHSVHGSIFTPRIGYKYVTRKDHIFRLNLGTGYRVVNIFTEDHAALTGARDVIIDDQIMPEQSYNANLNYAKTFINKKNQFLTLDVTAFHTYFTNRIIADYDSNPNEIRYNNLSGYAISQGMSLNLTCKPVNELTVMIGATAMDISIYENGMKELQILTEKFSGTWNMSYTIPQWNLSIDYTGNIYSPMRLPLLNDADPRPAQSPWWSIQNIQLRYKGRKHWEIYGGIKNLLNWTPDKSAPFLIARSHDPFDKEVQFDAERNALPTPDNPYGLTFDPSYVYAPNQGIRGFLGVRYTLRSIR